MDGKDSTQVPAPKMLLRQRYGRPMPPTAIRRQEPPLRVEDVTVGEENAAGQVEQVATKEFTTQEYIDTWKGTSCTWRPAIWYKFMLAKDWKTLSELIDHSGLKYPVFKVKDIQSAFAECGSRYDTAEDPESFSEVSNDDRNGSLHLAILDVAENDNEDAKNFVSKLLDGVKNCYQFGYFPFLAPNNQGENPMHLAAKRLKDFDFVEKFFRQEIKFKAGANQDGWLGKKDKDDKTIIDIVAQREDCNFKAGFQKLFSERFKSAEPPVSADASNPKGDQVAQRSGICTIS